MYELTADPSTVHRLSDGAFIPNDEKNPDWRAYLAWKEEGNVPGPAPDVPPELKSLSVDDLAAILVKKLILSQSDIQKK
jgi:hypothetical protein